MTDFAINFLHVVSNLHLLVLRVKSHSSTSVRISARADLMLLYCLNRAVLVKNSERITFRLDDDSSCRGTNRKPRVLWLWQNLLQHNEIVQFILTHLSRASGCFGGLSQILRKSFDLQCQLESRAHCTHLFITLVR